MKRKMRSSTHRRKAHELVRDPLFLQRMMERIGELGVGGEEKNRLILFLAGLTKELKEPVSVLVKGSTSSGKSNLARNVLAVFPPECVIARASLSAKALAHNRDSLSGKILYLYEYRGGKDAQLLLRLQQSEGSIAHEYTALWSKGRRTEVATRIGRPVIVTTTTEDRVFDDDETRFLSVWVDESPSQVRAILKAQAAVQPHIQLDDLPVWQEAVRLICGGRCAFHRPPWLEFIAVRLPTDRTRVLRDWNRFLAFCTAIAMCRQCTGGDQDRKAPAINFSDYCVAYKILNSALASTSRGVPMNELELVSAVHKLHLKLGRGVSVKELAGLLSWKTSLVYKHAKRAVEDKLLMLEAGVRPANEKPLLPVPGSSVGFLPPPHTVFQENVELGDVAEYVDPLSGRTVRFYRRNPNAPKRSYRQEN